MIVYYMRGKHGHSCAGATHMTKVFVKRTILFLPCGIPHLVISTHEVEFHLELEWNSTSGMEFHLEFPFGVEFHVWSGFSSVERYVRI